MSSRQPFSLRPLVFLYNLSKNHPRPIHKLDLVILIPIVMNMVMVRLRGSQLLHRRRDLSHFSATQLQLALPAGDNQHQHFHDHFHQDCDDDFNGNFVMIFITIRTINTFKILTLNIKNDIRDVCSTDGSLTFC